VERDSYELFFSAAFDQLNAFFAGQPVNLANPDVQRR
jgi:D-3-phosphoglycerate dehydrogenase